MTDESRNESGAGASSAEVMEFSSGQFRRVTWWDEHGGKVSAGIATAFLLGASAWAVQMDRQSVRIGYALEQIQTQLDKQNSKLGELNQLEKRLTRIEDSRFTDKDAKAFIHKCDLIEERVRVLEMSQGRRR